MNYKVGFLLFLSSGISAHKPDKAIKLLDKVHEAQAYWEVMARDKKLGFWKRPPHKWLSWGWKKEIVNHQRALAKRRAELIHHLGIISENPKALSYLEAVRVQDRATVSLMHHGTPSHFNRRWLSYAGVIASTAALVFYLHRFQQEHVLFILDAQSRSLASTLEDTHPFLGHDYVTKDGQQYLQVKKEDEVRAKHFLENQNISYEKDTPQLSLCWYNEQGESKVREFIWKHGIQPVQEIYKILRNESPVKTEILTTDKDFNKDLYEQQLISVLKDAQKVEQTAPLMTKYLNGRTIEDLQFQEKRNVFDALLFSLGELLPDQMRIGIEQLHTTTKRTAILSLDTKTVNEPVVAPSAQTEKDSKSLIKAFGDLKTGFGTLEQKIERLASEDPAHLAKVEETVGEIAPIYLAPQGVNDLAQNVGVVLRKADKGLDKADKLADKINALLVETQSYSDLIKALIANISTMAEKNTGLASLVFKIILTNAFEIKLKGAALGHEIHTFAERSKLNVELSATIPLMLTTYLGYLAASGIYRHATALTILTPLKTDLISLQLVLNKERYTKDCAALSLDYKGECFYWIQRLHRYKDGLPGAYRATYRRYLDDLENQILLPEQKMIIIDCLFKELDPLFKKD